MPFSLTIRSTTVSQHYDDPEKYTIRLNYYYYEPKENQDSSMDYSNYDTTLEAIETAAATPNILLPEKVVEDMKLVVQWARQIAAAMA